MGVNFLFVGLLAVCCVYAWWRGGTPERIGATIFAVGTLVTHLVVGAPSFRFRTVEHGVLLVDIAAFVAFLMLALCANRFWPLWVTGLLGVGIVGHLAKLSSPGVVPWAYAVVLSIWSYPILAILALGTWQHRKRMKRFGADKSWSSFLSRPGPSRPGPTPRG
jgi:hypothetical protein